VLDQELVFPECIPDEENIPARERALLDLFVQEYLVDYSPTNAAMRCGFQKSFAVQYGMQFMERPYVQRRIKALEFAPADPKADEEYNKARVKQALIKEAYYKGPGSSHAARVTALRALAELYGMQAPKRVEQNVKVQGGVMQVPGIASLDEWEQAAAESQEKLVRDTRSD